MATEAIVVTINGVQGRVPANAIIVSDGAITVRDRITRAVVRFEAQNLPKERDRLTWPHN